MRVNGNEEKNLDEIEKTKRESKQKSKTNTTEQRGFEGMMPEIGCILVLNSKYSI